MFSFSFGATVHIKWPNNPGPLAFLINKQDRVCLPTCTIEASRTVIVKAVPAAAAIYIPSMHLINCFATFALLDLLQVKTSAFHVSVL